MAKQINAGINVACLIDQHLLAEYKFIPEILNFITFSRGRTSNIPKLYSMDAGHQTLFFFDKLLYLHRRYQQVVDELRRRRFRLDPSNVTAIEFQFAGVFECYPNLFDDDFNEAEVRATTTSILIQQVEHVKNPTYGQGFIDLVTANKQVILNHL